MERIGPYTFNPGGADEITSDTLQLADFIPSLNSSHSLIDIGSASGAIPLFLASRNINVKITAVEVLASRAKVLRSNVAANGLLRRISVLNKDYRTLAGEFTEGAFTHVVTNPPYMKKGTGRVSPDFERQVARTEVFGVLSDLVRVSAHLIGSDGGLYIILPVTRFTELLGEMRERGLRPVRLRYVHPRKGEPACRVLVEARRGTWVRSEPVDEPVFLLR